MKKNIIASFEDACKKLKISNTLPDVSMLPIDEQDAVVSWYKIVIIAKAINGKWVPNFLDSNQKKWYPFFTYNASSAGFRFFGFVLPLHGHAHGCRVSPLLQNGGSC